MRARSLQGHEFSRRLSDGQVDFQHCGECGRIQYPPAELCRECLSSNLAWGSRAPDGKVVACVAVHRSYAEDFAQDGPWWVASVSLRPGIVCYAHVLEYLPAGRKVSLVAIKDRLGDGVLGAVTEQNEQAALQARFR